MRILLLIAALAATVTSTVARPPAQPDKDDGFGTVEDQVIEWINAADATQLQQIKGIGRVLSARIIAKQIDEFHNYEDILAVKGIGKVLLKRIIDHVVAIDPD